MQDKASCSTGARRVDNEKCSTMARKNRIRQKLLRLHLLKTINFKSCTPHEDLEKFTDKTTVNTPHGPKSKTSERTMLESLYSELPKEKGLIEAIKLAQTEIYSITAEQRVQTARSKIIPRVADQTYNLRAEVIVYSQKNRINGLTL